MRDGNSGTGGNGGYGGYQGDEGPGELNAYVFIQNADREAIERLRALVNEELEPGLTGARFMFELSGPDEAMIVVQASDLAGLQAFVTGEIRGQGSMRTITSVALDVVLGWIKLTRRRAFEAIVRGRVSRGAMGGLAGELEKIPAYMGGAFVLGEHDTVLEFGADTWKGLLEGLRQAYASELFEYTVTGVTEFPDQEGDGSAA